MTELTHEQRILRMMRLTLAGIIKDTTPRDGQPTPLSEASVENIRDCLLLISTREREIGEALGYAEERPYFSDEPPAAKAVPVNIVRK